MMKILNKLSIKNLKLNKKRTISTIIGIILSVALICAVATMATSFRATLIENAINETGYYHVNLFRINDDDIKNLQNNRDIKDIYTISQIGYGLLDKSKNKDKPYLKLSSIDKKTFENFKFNLIKGRFPDNNSEIIISNHIIGNAKIDYRIGDKIKVNIGQRKSLDGYELDSYNPYNKEAESLVNIEEKEFTVVGIMERPNYYFESYSDPGYTVFTTNMNKSTKDTYITLKNPKDYKNSITELLGAKSYEQIESNENLKYENYNINRELLRWEAFAFSDSTVNMLFAVCAIVIFIIVFTSVFCIRNSFAIMAAEKIKMYGMLASIGATKKQIKKNVIFEGLMLGVIRNSFGNIIWYICCICINKNSKFIIRRIFAFSCRWNCIRCIYYPNNIIYNTWNYYNLFIFNIIC